MIVDSNQRQFSRDQLRSARASAMADAEGFLAVVRAIELIGQQQSGRVADLGKYKKVLRDLAETSPLCIEVPLASPDYHISFDTLYEELRQARNDAVHQGAYARILTARAVELGIVLEDALMSNASRISQFMVRDVVEAKPWYPVSYVRQQMLEHSFSYLPIRLKHDWKLISDYSVARYLRGSSTTSSRNERLLARVCDAIERDELQLLEADAEAPETDVTLAMSRLCAKPILVIDPNRNDTLVGLLTSSDVL